MISSSYILTIVAFIILKVCVWSFNQTKAQQMLANSCERMRFVSRSNWDAHQAQGSLQTLSTVPYRVFIHQAWDGQTCQDIDSCIIRVKSIQAYNMFDKRWPDISYNFLIAGNGAVFEGLGWGVRGFHTLNYNEESLGIAFIGTFHDVYPNARMEQALRDLLDCGVQRGLLDPNYLIHGHRDARCTICPGNALYSRIATYPRFQAGPLSKYSCPFNNQRPTQQLPGAAAGISSQSSGRPGSSEAPNILNQMIIKENSDRVTLGSSSKEGQSVLGGGDSYKASSSSSDLIRGITLRPFKIETAALVGGSGEESTRMLMERANSHSIGIVNITAFGGPLIR